MTQIQGATVEAAMQTPIKSVAYFLILPVVGVGTGEFYIKLDDCTRKFFREMKAGVGNILRSENKEAGGGRDIFVFGPEHPTLGNEGSTIGNSIGFCPKGVDVGPVFGVAPGVRRTTEKETSVSFHPVTSISIQTDGEVVRLAVEGSPGAVSGKVSFDLIESPSRETFVL